MCRELPSGRRCLEGARPHSLRSCVRDECGLLRNGARMSLRSFVAGAAFLAAFLVSCGASLDQIDPVTHVDGTTCPDSKGVPQPLIAGYQCCADHDLGPGQCPEETSCMLPDGCSSPLPPNDPGLARHNQRRSL